MSTIWIRVCSFLVDCAYMPSIPTNALVVNIFSHSSCYEAHEPKH